LNPFDFDVICSHSGKFRPLVATRHRSPPIAAARVNAQHNDQASQRTAARKTPSPAVASKGKTFRAVERQADGCPVAIGARSSRCCGSALHRHQPALVSRRVTTADGSWLSSKKVSGFCPDFKVRFAANVLRQQDQLITTLGP
jgi:hypothetical protein